MAKQGFHLTDSRTKSVFEPGVLMENHKNITFAKKRKQIKSHQAKTDFAIQKEQQCANDTRTKHSPNCYTGSSV